MSVERRVRRDVTLIRDDSLYKELFFIPIDSKIDTILSTHYY